MKTSMESEMMRKRRGMDRTRVTSERGLSGKIGVAMMKCMAKVVEGSEEQGGNPEDTEGHWVGGCPEVLLRSDEDSDGKVGEELLSKMIRVEDG